MRASGDGGVPDLAVQVGAYLSTVASTADPDTLYFINVGGNDVRDMLVAGLSGAPLAAAISAAVEEITSAITSLSMLGGKHFLVAGVGNVGGVPETIAFGPAAEAAGRALSVAFNASLFSALPPDVSTVDTIALFDAVLLVPPSSVCRRV